MPELSRFYGIVVRMFFEAGEPHHRESHQQELLDDWTLLQDGRLPKPIEPLR